MERQAIRTGPAGSVRQREPKRYLRRVEGFVTRTSPSSMTVAGVSGAAPVRVQVGPRTIVWRAGQTVSTRRELAVGVAVRVMFVAVDGACLAVMIELLGVAGGPGAGRRPPSRALTVPVLAPDVGAAFAHPVGAP